METTQKRKRRLIPRWLKVLLITIAVLFLVSILLKLILSMVINLKATSLLLAL